MEAVYQSLATSVLAQYEELNSKTHGSRLLIAIGGPPGSGKTTLANRVSEIINSNHEMPVPITTVVSMDGYHWPRSYLDELPNREEAYVRRGAPWTFDSQSIVDMVHSLRTEPGDINAPTFDHATKDPVTNGLLIPVTTKIILLEGNYLLVDEKPWSEIKSAVNSCWLVTVDQEVARQRVARRHVSSGIENDMESALLRVDRNDTLNGVYIMEHSKKSADVLIESVSV